MIDVEKRVRIIGPAHNDLIGLEGDIKEISSHPYGAHFGNVYLVEFMQPGVGIKEVWHNERDLEVIVE